MWSDSVAVTLLGLLAALSLTAGAAIEGLIR